MSATALDSKATRLFLLLGAFFVTNALLAEFVGVKIFSLEVPLPAPGKPSAGCTGGKVATSAIRRERCASAMPRHSGDPVAR
jgi:hypothetical protein